ncbi:MAG: acyltransferase, partial [Saprospiraceae bacterium]
TSVADQATATPVADQATATPVADQTTVPSVADQALTPEAANVLSETEVADKTCLSATKVADTIRRAWLLIVFGTALTAIGTWWASQTYGNVFHGFFYDYLTPGVTISAIGWFLLARHAWNGQPLIPFEAALSAASFGMYFVHVLVMDWWSEAGYWQSKGHPALWIPVVAVMVYVMSFVFVALLRTTGWGRRVT